MNQKSKGHGKLLFTLIALSLLVTGCPALFDPPNLGTGPFEVGSLGPSGGYVFYDKGYYSDGWRFLEAAPAGWNGTSEDPYILFGYYHINQVIDLMVGTGTAVGAGKSNTSAMVSAMGTSHAYGMYYATTPITNYAAMACAAYHGGGYDGWFLPSIDEMDLMCRNLYGQGLGGLSWDLYWSSSEFDPYKAWSFAFQSGSHYSYARWYTSRIRPVRAF